MDGDTLGELRQQRHRQAVTAKHIAQLVEIAVNDTCHQTNPKPVSAADFERIFN
jgi:alcohol dehydrogenase class IV